jgi:hypothetical protein
MSTDFHQIQLTDQQKMWVAQVADQTGKPWTEVLEERLLPDSPLENGAITGDDHAYIQDREKWLAHFRDWVGRQRSRNPDVDDSRDSIYP